MLTLAMILVFIFVFLVDISLNLRRVNNNMVKLMKKYEEVRVSLSERGLEYSKIFDWKSVAAQILDVYEVAVAGGAKVTLASENRGWRRLRNE